LQAGDEELLVGPRLGSASRSTDSRSVGAFNARVRNRISAVVSRILVPSLFAVVRAPVLGVAIRPPRRQRCRCVESQRDVVVGQTALLDLAVVRRAGDGPQDADPLKPQCLGCGDVLGAGDGLMPGPDAFVVSEDLAVSEHPHPRQVSDHLDPAADHRRVHRVVVAVQTHVIIACQPRRGPPAGRRRDRRQRQHRLPISGDPIGRCATRRPPLAARTVWTMYGSWVESYAQMVDDFNWKA
jgi:hypothetical protein